MRKLRRLCPCGGVITDGKCDSCGPTKKTYDQERLNAHQRGYTRKWKAYTLRFKKRWPVCAHCERIGKTSEAKHVDHIIRVKGRDDPLFWESWNHQGLCARCHSWKTNLENCGQYTPTEDLDARRRQLDEN